MKQLRSWSYRLRKRSRKTGTACSQNAIMKRCVKLRNCSIARFSQRKKLTILDSSLKFNQSAWSSIIIPRRQLRRQGRGNKRTSGTTTIIAARYLSEEWLQRSKTIRTLESAWLSSHSRKTERHCTTKLERFKDVCPRLEKRLAQCRSKPSLPW